MSDDELETFVDQWMAIKVAEYHATERFAGAGDLGRDVVGYRTEQKLQGPWHNFQCKQLSKPLNEAAALLELGKILYYSSVGHYSLPTKFVFVAPRGVARSLKNLLANPTKLRARVREKWDDFCAKRISSGNTCVLTPPIEAAISAFDFSAVHALDAALMLKDGSIKPCLVSWFGEDPGKAPAGKVPSSIQTEESEFVGQLMAAYGERVGAVFADVNAVVAHPDFGEHLRLQRRRYFDAEAFKRYYRENTPPEYLEVLEDDVYFGVVDEYNKAHVDTLEKVDRVMAQAASVNPSGVLAKYARVTVRQGYCHHFANARKMPWTK